jgi:hypothetical protein
VSIDDTVRTVEFPHTTFGTVHERTHAGTVSAYLRALPARVQAKCGRDGISVYTLPDRIGVSWGAITTLANGELLGVLELLLVMTWLGDFSARGPLTTPVPDWSQWAQLGTPQTAIGPGRRRKEDDHGNS